MAKGLPKTGDWCDTESVMRTLNISARTVQKYAQLGWLKYKTAREGKRRLRLYDEADVERMRTSGAPHPADDKAGDGKTVAPARLPLGRQNAALRRNFSFAAPEGRIAVSLPADLAEENRAHVLAFLELVTRQVARWPKTAVRPALEPAAEQSDENRAAAAG